MHKLGKQLKNPTVVETLACLAQNLCQVSFVPSKCFNNFDFSIAFQVWECVYIFQGRYLRFLDAPKTTALVGYLCHEETRSLRLCAGCGHVVWGAGKLGVGSVRCWAAFFNQYTKGQTPLSFLGVRVVGWTKCGLGRAAKGKEEREDLNDRLNDRYICLKMSCSTTCACSFYALCMTR